MTGGRLPQSLPPGGRCRPSSLPDRGHGRGLLLDIHGQAAKKDVIFRGTSNGKTCSLLTERLSGKTVAVWGEGPSYLGPGGVWYNRQR